MEALTSTNQYNNFSVSELNYIRDFIETMNKFNQIEVLRILKKNNEVTLNENKNGIHVNLSELKKNILDELTVFIDYVKTQEINLNSVEKQKNDYKNAYFTKERDPKQIALK
jgi:DNA integrity scanning protein DisA with diadenylate cyclase activity